MKWPIETVSNVAEVNPRLAAADRPAPDALVSFVPMAAVSEKTCRIETHKEKCFAEVSKGYTPFRRGDILIAKITPCFENGKMVLGENLSHELGFGTTEFHVLRPSEKIDGAYLFNLLRAPHVRKAGAMRMKGAAGQRRVPADFFSNLQIPLPPLAEQNRIAAILGAAEDLRAKRRKTFSQLDTLIQSTFLEMFGDPVTNPMGWDLQPLEKLGSLDRGVSKHRPRNAPHLLGGSHPLIQTGDVSNSGGYIRDFFSTYSDEGLSQSKKWPKGTLCITIAANIARTGILTFDACFPDSVVGFISDQKGRSEYVQGLFWFLHEILERKAPQVAQKNINLKILRNLPVLTPPIALQQRFSTIVQSIEQQKTRLRAHLAELDTLFASLQSRAFKGEL